MFLSTALLGAACWLLARQASRDEKSPIETLGGFALLGASAWAAAVAAGPVPGRVASYLLAAGIGLVLAAGFIARRRGPARPFFALGLASLLAASLLFAGIRVLSIGRDTVELLVELGADDRIEEIQPILDRYRARAERAFPEVTPDENGDLAQVFIVRAPAHRASGLARALGLDVENVDHVEANRRLSLEPPIPGVEPGPFAREVRENDPLVSRQWALEAIGGHEAHALLQGLRPVRRARLAIVDTGIDARHEDIRQAFAASPGSRDPHGHGSHCAGIAGGVTNNGLGIASLNWEGRFVEVRGYTALDGSGSGSIEQIAQAVVDAAEDDADVVSLSLGERSADTPKTLSDAIAYARSRGAVVVASAGNADEDAAGHVPSNVEGVIVVAALDRGLQKARFSNTNTSLARPIAAPGVDILSLRPGGGYVSMSGTSMSTPMVAGLAAVLRSLDPSLDEESVYGLLVRTARKVPDEGSTGRMIDAGAAVKAVLDGRSS